MVAWTALTRIDRKHLLYREETYFREAVADFTDVFGDRTESVLHGCALLMVKPDGIAARKVRAVAEFLRRNGFSVLAVERPSLAGQVWRELWRYQLNAATLDRLLVNEVVLAGTALLLLVRYDGPADPLPAAVLLSELKGPADVTQQHPDCLRRHLAQPNRVFSLVHVANEPADVVRELGVLLDRPARQRLLTAFGSGALPAADRAVLARAVEEDARPARDLDPGAAADRVSRAVRERGGAVPATGPVAEPAVEEVLATLAEVRRGGAIHWRPFLRALAAIDVRVDHWDLATIGASSIHYDEPGRTKMIENVDPLLWRTAPAALAPTGPGPVS